MATAKKSEKKTNQVLPTYTSIYKAIDARVAKAKFTRFFIATQITLTGNINYQPLYVRIEDMTTEVAPYEYQNASFYMDADADAMAAILNNEITITDAISDGRVTMNGDPQAAILFVKAVFG